MATHKDYIPEGQEKFNNWQGSFMTNLHLLGGGWGLPPDEVDALDELQKTYITAYKKGNKMAKATRTTVDVAKLKTARDKYEAAIRHFVQAYLRFNNKVEDSHRMALGITVPDTIRTKRDTPKTTPWVSTITQKGANVKVWAMQEPGADGTSHRAKPKDVARIELAAFIGPEPPIDPEDFSMKTQHTRSPILLHLDQKYCGMPIIIYCRFIGFNNQPGSWSKGHKEVVPM
jgi:hypothetical protein